MDSIESNFFTKKNKILLTIAFIFLASIDLYFLNYWFYTIIFSYWIFIKFLLSEYTSLSVKKVFKVTLWLIFITLFALGLYVNYKLPHGPSYATGDIVCQNDDRGPCTEEYKEDMQFLDIPDWAKFIRRRGIIFLFASAFAGIVAGASDKKNY